MLREIIDALKPVSANSQKSAEDANANRQTLGQVLALLKKTPNSETKEIITKVTTIVNGAGWSWDKINQLKKLLS
jgi:hypothetical protein